MTPQELAKKHCYNGHDPARCELLVDILQLLVDEREKCAKVAENYETSQNTKLPEWIAEAIRQLKDEVRYGS